MSESDVPDSNISVIQDEIRGLRQDISTLKLRVDQVEKQPPFVNIPTPRSDSGQVPFPPNIPFAGAYYHPDTSPAATGATRISFLGLSRFKMHLTK